MPQISSHALYHAGHHLQKPTFQTVPREIRDKIYGYLLVVDRYIAQVPLDHKKHLETSIIYVNRQIHEEALEALHQKNCWLLFILDGVDYDLLSTWSSGILPPFKREVSQSAKNMAVEFKVGLSEGYRERAALVEEFKVNTGATLYAVVSLFAIPKFWRFLVPWPLKEMHATLNITDFRSDFQRQLPLIPELRGFCQVRIEGNHTIEERDKMIGMMTRPFRRCLDLLEILSIYKAQALKQEELGQSHSARCTYLEAIWLLLRWISHGSQRLTTLDDGCVNHKEIDLYRREISFASARLTLKLGPQQQVHEIMDELFRNRWVGDEGDKKWGQQLVEAHLLDGLACAYAGKINAAVYYLMEVLNLEPGHTEADALLDEIERCLLHPNGRGKHETALENLQVSAKPYRHQKQLEKPITTQEYEHRYCAGKAQPFRAFKDCEASIHKVRYEVDPYRSVRDTFLLGG